MSVSLLASDWDCGFPAGCRDLLRVSATGRQPPVVTVRDFSSEAACYADANGRDRPEAVSRPLSDWSHLVRMLLRFVTSAQDSDSGHSCGILVEAHSLRDDRPLEKDEHEKLRLLLGWFTENLPVPRVLNNLEHRRAISWFKPTANDAIKKMWELKHFLESHGINASVLTTNEPGTIIYEDEWQVVAKPPRGTRY